MKFKLVSDMADISKITQSIEKKTFITSDIDLDSIIDSIYQEFHTRYGIEGINVSVLDDSGKFLIPFKLYNPLIDDQVIKKVYKMSIPIDFNGGMAAYSIQNKETVFVNEFKKEYIFSQVGKDISSIMDIKSNIYYPLFIGEDLFGIITFPVYSHKIDLSEKQLEEMTQRIQFLSIAVISICALLKVQEKDKMISKRNQELSAELSLARQIQLTLMDDSFLAPGFAAYAFYKPMNELGGDFYSFHNIDLQQDSFFIADVSGHGTPAALIATLVKGLIDSYPAEIKSNPSLLLYKINKHIYGKIKNNFLTAFYGVFDLSSRILKYSRAGHCLPYLIRDNILELDGKGHVIGLDEHLIPDINTIKIEKGDRLVLFTDGIIEIENEGLENFENQFKELCLLTKKLNSKDALFIIQEEIKNFRGLDKFEDDICVVMLDFIES